MVGLNHDNTDYSDNARKLDAAADEGVQNDGEEIHYDTVIKEWVVKEDVDDGKPDGKRIDAWADFLAPDGVTFTKDGKGDGISVSTDGLKAFANYLDEVKESLLATEPMLDGMEIKAGAFWSAHELVRRLDEGDPEGAGGGGAGVGGVRRVTRQYLYKVGEALGLVASDLRRLAGKYDTEEELNAASGKTFKEYIEGSMSKLNKVTGGTNASLNPDEETGGDGTGGTGENAA